MNYFKNNLMAIGGLILMIFGLTIEFLINNPTPRDVLNLSSGGFIFIGLLIILQQGKTN